MAEKERRHDAKRPLEAGEVCFWSRKMFFSKFKDHFDFKCLGLKPK